MPPADSRLPRPLADLTLSIPTIVVLALIVGLLVAPFAWQYSAATAPTVAVVPIAGFIDGPNAADISDRLHQARTANDVEAVVLLVDSTGGTANAGEEVFMQVDRTAQEMPVVAVIDSSGTSGAYKAILPAEHIYTKPGTPVGSVGTTMGRPPAVGPVEEEITSGPDKLVGTSPRGAEYFLEVTSRAFLDHVMEYRGDELQLSREEVAHATIFTGIQAVEFGLVDEIGDRQVAIQHAADSADLESYRVREYQYDTEVRFLAESTYASADVPNKSMMSTEALTALHEDPALPSVLLIPPGTVEALQAEQATSPQETEGDDGD